MLLDFFDSSQNCPPTGGAPVHKNRSSSVLRPLRAKLPSQSSRAPRPSPLLSRQPSQPAASAVGGGGPPPIRGQQKMETPPGCPRKPVFWTPGTKMALMGPTPSPFQKRASPFCFSELERKRPEDAGCGFTVYGATASQCASDMHNFVRQHCVEAV